MTPRLICTALALTLLAGCGSTTHPLAVRSVALSAANASSTAQGTRLLAAFDQKPSLGLIKQPKPLSIILGGDMRALPIEPTETPVTILKIQTLALTGLAEAEKKENWNDRWAVTEAALQQIDDVKLQTSGLNNVPAKVGIYAAKAYGYLGMPPTHENRYKVQAVTLGFLRENDAEATLARGASLFTMSADMLEVTTGWDQGFRVGISVLSTLKDNYKERAVAKSCDELLKKSVAAPTKEESYKVMVDGLNAMAEKLKK